ncbi:acyl carrier protein [Solihabitans fulvus]|uniref:Acyl carrier protein n=1 Tax=Solihabitans fulvus TaxID=1892852 RepID=A0A5B2WIA0_9PSEU|nr:phosphopantetheine-binding protein [Solihabitans fulvus]KAA2250146.1 acyl carrier protein [Solihabitans fulvus]
MTEDDKVGRRVREIIGEMCPLGEREARSTDRVTDDLGYDSVGIVELAMVLEQEFELQPIDEEQAIDIVTVGDVEELVRLATAAA